MTCGGVVFKISSSLNYISECELSIGYSGLLYAGRLPMFFLFQRISKRLAYNRIKAWLVVVALDKFNEPHGLAQLGGVSGENKN